MSTGSRARSTRAWPGGSPPATSWSARPRRWPWPTTATPRRLRSTTGRGAINAQHYGCHVFDLGPADEAQLLHATQELGFGGVPGALLTTTDHDGRRTVTIRLYDADGQLVTQDTGWAPVREKIARDRVPIPVNDQAKGLITERRHLVEAP